MTVSWKAIPDAPGYTVRAYSKGNPTKYYATAKSSINLTGLKANTTYFLKVYVNKPATASSNAVVMSASSPEVTTTTSTYALAAPDALKETSQAAYSVGLAWTAVSGAPAGSAYKVTYALDAAGTDHAKTTGRLNGTSGTLTGLTNDTTYFA